jgi:deoxyribose-phosphate aldolase
MLLVAIKEALDHGQQIGLKISGGIKHLAQVSQYFSLVREIVGEQYIDKSTLRFGASSLLDELVKYASGHDSTRVNINSK